VKDLPEFMSFSTTKPEILVFTNVLSDEGIYYLRVTVEIDDDD